MYDKKGIYLVTDSEILKNRDFFYEIEEVLKAGVSVIQLREKDCSGKEFLKKALKIRELTKKYDAMFIINDRIDIAMISDADGIHIGQDDIDIISARKLVENKIIGVSVSNLEQAREAEKNGADYIGVGAIFKTSTKSNAKEVGLDMLSKIKQEIKIPVVAIGGINTDNIIDMKKINIDGYAIISEILKYNDVGGKCREFIKIVG